MYLNKKRIAWNKGISWNEETKRKISEKLKGRKSWNKGLPKEQQPRFGKPVSINQIENMRKVGKLSFPTWNKGLKEYSPRIRDKILRNTILERDGKKCIQCGNENQLIIHHKICLEKIAKGEEIHTLNNLITLCKSCHLKEHNKRKLIIREGE